MADDAADDDDGMIAGELHPSIHSTQVNDATFSLIR
jgi:hypothetical protein